jgi:hypothetical protein
MTLFDFDSRYRERKAIWRVLELGPLRWGMPEGMIFRWYAANIPMSLVPNSGFDGDIDLIVCLRNGRGATADWIYKTWEIKVALVDNRGRPRSMKSGKTRGLLTQLANYRRFGCPDISLLELYVCESGYFATHKFPPDAAADVIRSRMAALAPESFGYQVLPFEHGKDGDVDVGLLIQRASNPMAPATTQLLRSARKQPAQPFIGLTERLKEFGEVESVTRRVRLGFCVITYCYDCRELVLLSMKGRCECYRCGGDLISR